jgi:outer membrane protein assembly factor BamB
VRPLRTTISCVVFAALLITSGAPLLAGTGRSSLPLGLRWSVDIGAPPVARASPVSDDHAVYLALRTGQIAAYDLADGHERWRKDLAVTHPLATGGDLLFAATEDTIVALHGADGTIAWETPAAITAPLYARAGWLIAMSGGNVLAFRADDGARVWQRDIGTITIRPAIAEDILYVVGDDGRILALQLSNGEQVWQQGLEGAAETPLVTGGRLYSGTSDRVLYCLDARSGEKIWFFRLGAPPRGSATADASRVYLVTLDNLVRAFDLRSGNQRWIDGLRHRPATGSVALGPIVMVASANSAEIWTWAATSGKSGGSIAIPAEPAVPPAFVDRGDEGAFVFVVTGGLAGQWQLTLLATAGDPPLVPLSALPGEPLDPKR